MFDVLDSALFRLLNDYARSSVLDAVLPFFSFAWPFWLGIVSFLVFFTLYCRKQYGSALWRLLALGIVLSLSVCVSAFGSFLMKDVFERSRPYQNLSGTVYYDSRDNEWVRIQILQSTADAKSPALVDAGVGVGSLSAGNLSSEKSTSLEGAGVKTGNSVQPNIILDAKNATISDIIKTVGAQSIAPTYKTIGCDAPALQNMLQENGYSMPSAFAANVMALALVIALLFHKTSPWIYMMPLLCGWSRIYTGNSYPLDILVGWILGIVSVAVAWLLCDLVFKSVSKNRQL